MEKTLSSMCDFAEEKFFENKKYVLCSEGAGIDAPFMLLSRGRLCIASPFYDENYSKEKSAFETCMGKCELRGRCLKLK